MKLEHIRAEIERMRTQIHRQRGDIKQLVRAGISTRSAKELLIRMQDTVGGLCAERDRLVGEKRMKQPKYAGTDEIIRGAQMRGMG